MKKYLYIILFCMLSLLHASAQQPREGYSSKLFKTLEDFRAGRYILEDSLYLTRAADREQNTLTTSYRVEGATKDISKKARKQIGNAWGFIYNDELYVNRKGYTKHNSYAKALTNGRYVLLFSEIPTNIGMRDYFNIPESMLIEHRNTMSAEEANSLLSGLYGLSASTIESKEVFFPMVIDTETGAARSFSIEYANKLALNHPKINYFFEPKGGKYTYEHIVYYLDYLNNVAAGVITFPEDVLDSESPEIEDGVNEKSQEVRHELSTGQQ